MGTIASSLSVLLTGLFFSGLGGGVGAAFTPDSLPQSHEWPSRELRSHPSPSPQWLAQQTPKSQQPVSVLLDRNNFTDGIRQLEKQWSDQYGKFLGVQPPPVFESVNTITRVLAAREAQTGQKAGLIYLMPEPDTLHIVLVLPDGQPVHRTVDEAKLDRLKRVLKTFQSGLSDPTTEPVDYLEAAQQLYGWMIAPIEADLQKHQIETLIFCVGGGLRSTPFAALHDGQQFLVEQYGVALIPAFNWLESEYVDIRQGQVLAMGASQFQELSPLPAVPLEVETIAGGMGRGNSFLNEAFTLGNLQQLLARQRFQVVHLATHAEFESGSAENSFIQFWRDRLKLTQLKELKLGQSSVQLLVLSACRTAMGDLDAELGFAGLAVQSGVKTSVASLWSVSDVGTLVLMTDFYRNLRSLPTKAEALRQTQIRLIRGELLLNNSGAIDAKKVLPNELANFQDQPLSHPFFWAPFTIIGNPW